MAKLTNHVQRTRLITPSTDKHYSLDSEDDFRSGCRNVSHQQQFFSELLSPGRSHNTNYYNHVRKFDLNETATSKLNYGGKQPQLTQNLTLLTYLINSWRSAISLSCSALSMTCHALLISNTSRPSGGT